MLEPCFNLHSIQATTHPVAPLLIVHGPIAQQIGMNAGAGTFGPSSLANATIGRAIRLILWNLGGAHAGKADRSTQGSPAKYGFCIAENAAASPWGSFITERGLPEGANAVTVFGGEPPHNINDHEHGDAEGILRIAADTLHPRHQQLVPRLARAQGTDAGAESRACGERRQLGLVAAPGARIPVRHDRAPARRTGARRHVRHARLDAGAQRPGDGRACRSHRAPTTSSCWSPAAAASDSAALPSFGATVSVTRAIRTA